MLPSQIDSWTTIFNIISVGYCQEHIMMWRSRKRVDLSLLGCTKHVESPNSKVKELPNANDS